MLLLSDFTEHIHNVGSSHNLHSVIQSGLIPRGRDVRKGRHAVFFEAVNPMLVDQHRERDYDVTKPRIAVSKQSWKNSQATPFWGPRAVPGKRTFVDSSNHLILTKGGKYANTEHSPFLLKLQASGSPIRAAVTRYGSTWILSNGAAHNHISKNMIDGFS